MNPQTRDDKTVNSDLSKLTTAKQPTDRKPYRVVARKNEAYRMSLHDAEPANAIPLVRLSSKPTTVFSPQESLTNKKILAALADDPDPAASLAGIRKLLVGPTRNLHDAMFEELVTILEESDRDVQGSLQSLENAWSNMSVVTNNLIAESETIREHTEKLSNFVRDEFERVESLSQVKLSEMFLTIDAKIERMSAQVAKQVAEVQAKLATDMTELTARLEKKIEQMAEKSALESPKLVKRQDEDDEAAVHHVSLAERLRALRET